MTAFATEIKENTEKEEAPNERAVFILERRRSSPFALFVLSVLFVLCVLCVLCG
jgi:hypothetical protein